jgi:DNA-binding MarR family transcriptional regulator
MVTLGELISDMGVAFATLANHLERLQKQGLISTPDNNRPHNFQKTEKHI